MYSEVLHGCVVGDGLGDRGALAGRVRLPQEHELVVVVPLLLLRHLATQL